jgi:NAD(P)-dependent dehydrogenase (short-subunit alcohol dehydrogenase family)
MSEQAKVIVITGATRGLGQALAERFLDLGHTVLACGRSAETVLHLAQAFGPPHDFAVVDVAHDDQVDRWANRLIATHGAPDLLLNNAALINRNARLWEVPAKEFDAVVDVNIKGTVNVLRHFLPAMIARGRGVIVNFSSGWGRSTAPEVAPYCATKWAIEGLTQALNPGIIDTEMLRSCFGESAAEYSSPQQWSRTAAPFLLQLGAGDNGQPITAPGSGYES